MGERKVWAVAGTGLWLGALACGGTVDGGVLYQEWVEGAGPRQPAFLAFSPDYSGEGVGPLGASGFPKLLSLTGAFADVGTLKPSSGILPYEIQSPLWSDGAAKQRWLSVPADAVVGYSETEHLRVPSGTVFVKHFEMALDERFPEQRRRLETRFWVSVTEEAQYGVAYKWNDDQTDAELLVEGEVEALSIIGPNGETRTQSYSFPGPADCFSCHNAQSGFVLGARAAQLNRDVSYRRDRPAVNQLVAWSNFGLLDAPLDRSASLRAPQLVTVTDETAPLEERVRSYWEGNCSMCHAGAEGTIPGWDARYATPLSERGLEQPPRDTSRPASRLITPGEPEDSFIYLRGATTEAGLLMPPVGRSRVDEAYVDVLARWIASLGEAP